MSEFGGHTEIATMKSEEAQEHCPLCAGRTAGGETIFTVELGFGVVVVRHVPAMVCQSCGESWLEDGTTARLEQIVENARREHSHPSFA